MQALIFPLFVKGHATKDSQLQSCSPSMQPWAAISGKLQESMKTLEMQLTQKGEALQDAETQVQESDIKNWAFGMGGRRTEIGRQASGQVLQAREESKGLEERRVVCACFASGVWCAICVPMFEAQAALWGFLRYKQRCNIDCNRIILSPLT